MSDSVPSQPKRHTLVWLLVALVVMFWLGPAACLISLNPPGSHSRPHTHSDVTVSLLPGDQEFAFSAVGQGRLDLYLLDLQDHSVVQLTDSPAYETAPAVSPDGEWIVYAAGQWPDAADHLFRIRIDGEEKRQLTDSDGNDTAPAFSPDGKSVVFVRETEYRWGGLASNWTERGMVCVMDADGSDLRILVPEQVDASAPAFSADGRSIIYSANDERFAVSLDDQDRVTKLPGPAGALPSPNGEWLVYSRGHYSRDYQVFLLNTHSGEEVCLTPELGYCFKPWFSRTGDRIFFFHEEWPDGGTGEPKRNVWEIALEGNRQPREVFDYQLFDAPLKWTAAEQ